MELLGKTTLALGKPPIDEATTRISQAAQAIVDVLPVWRKTGDVKDLGAHGRRWRCSLERAMRLARLSENMQTGYSDKI